jgi:hypothetical protein
MGLITYSWPLPLPESWWTEICNRLSAWSTFFNSQWHWLVGSTPQIIFGHAKDSASITYTSWVMKQRQKFNLATTGVVKYNTFLTSKTNYKFRPDKLYKTVSQGDRMTSVHIRKQTQIFQQERCVRQDSMRSISLNVRTDQPSGTT